MLFALLAVDGARACDAATLAELRALSPERFFSAPCGAVVTLRFADASGPRQMQFTMAEIERLGVVAVTTSTPFTIGRLPLSGPPGYAIAQLVATDYSSVLVTSESGAVVEVEAEVFNYEAILATRLSDAPLAVRDRGPFWLVYDFDQARPERRDFLRARSVWHVASLTFR